MCVHVCIVLSQMYMYMYLLQISSRKTSLLYSGIYIYSTYMTHAYTRIIQYVIMYHLSFKNMYMSLLLHSTEPAEVLTYMYMYMFLFVLFCFWLGIYLWFFFLPFFFLSPILVCYKRELSCTCSYIRDCSCNS